ncbi:MAG: Gfo/Idh/MocA family oxidoreductase [Armatimonadia bacterium]
MRKVKYGVIGLGWFGEKHLEALQAIPQVEIYSLCTRTESRLSELKEKFGATKIFTDYNEMLADPELEAVSITTMWDQHKAPAVAALQAGKNVFLEKPMASTVEDCQAIVNAAKATDKAFMTGHIVRFNPRYAAGKDAIAEGKIGKIVSMYARRNIPAWVGASVLPKIGPIIGDGVHDTDILLWYSQDKVVSAYAQTTDVRGLGNPDIGWTMYRMESGATAVLENNWCLPDTTAMQIDERMEIIGTEGSVHIHETHPNFSLCDKTGWHSVDTTYWPIFQGRLTGALRDELMYFANCVIDGVKPTIITPEESMAAVKACLAAEESARTGKIVMLG